MTPDPAPPPHDPALAALLAENIRDNNQDNERALDFLDEARKAQDRADARNAKLVAEIAASHRELIAALAASRASDAAAAMLAAIPWDLSAERVRELLDERLGMIPGVEPPAPPGILPELDVDWYLATMWDEFVEYNWPTTPAGAEAHWIQFGKPEGRRGRANGPGWGPLWKDRPPGVG